MSKSIFITGASRGIGFEIAKKVIVDKANQVSSIILCARNSNEFDNSILELKRINQHNKQIIKTNIDLASQQDLKKSTEELFETIGNIDIIINNAGYTNPVPIQQIDIEDFQNTININLLAPFILVQSLLRQGNKFDTIINIASTAGISGRPGWLTYSCSKAALINMTEVMREELKIYGTRVICLSPGRTATSLRKTLAPDEDPQTIMQPAELAEIVSFMLSPQSKFIDTNNLILRS